MIEDGQAPGHARLSRWFEPEGELLIMVLVAFEAIGYPIGYLRAKRRRC
jgi:hypothetical protein